MLLLYRFGVTAYDWAIRISGMWNPKAKKWVDGRKNLLNHVESLLDPDEAKIWMHCPSLGEFEQGRSLLEEWRLEHPQLKIILTFFSPSGFEAQKNYPGVDHVFYLPIDSSRNARRLVRAINPALAVFIKYDFWLHYLQELKRKKTTTILVSGIFRPNQHFFSAFNQIGRRMLNCFDHFFVQDEQSVELLKKAGYENVSKSGDTRFDRVKTLAEQAEPLNTIGNFSNGHFTVVAGSTWPEDEKFLIPLINNPMYPVKWIIAPHEISESHLRQIEGEIVKPVVRYSDAISSGINPSQDVLIIDNIGLLSRIYQYADMAYVGGGFGKSIHNLLEAATWGAPVVFGPRHEKFAEASGLIRAGGAKSLREGPELEKIFEDWYRDSKKLKNASDAARDYVYANAGATNIVLSWLKANFQPHSR